MTQLPPESLTKPAQNIPPTPVVPSSNSKNIKIISVIVTGVILFSLAAYFFIQSQNKKQSVNQQKITPTSVEIVPTSTPENIDVSSWKTYTNSTYNYSINYPLDWIMREYSDPKTGAAFRPADKPNDTQYEYIRINKYSRVMFDDLANPTFEEYVKKAGAEIQNYNDLVTMKKIVTNSGVTGYTSTYGVSPMGGRGKEGVSSPRTYFEIPEDDTATIQVDIGDEKYIDIYNQMVLSFKVLEKKKQITDPNLKTYGSAKLGISFTYLGKQDSQEITVKENGNKICVTYDVADNDCSKGQSVEVFEKGSTETLKAAITRLILAGKDPNRCLVTISDPKNYPPTFVQGAITFPDNGEFDIEKMAADTEYCSADYSQTNGIRYFLEDKTHPTKFLFFSIGQYGISSNENKTWQETVSFE